MTPEIYDDLLGTLKREPLRLKQLHELAVQAGSRWSVNQLHLMLSVMDGVNVAGVDGNPLVSLGEQLEEDQLIDAILEIASASGKPMPAAQVLKLLPSRFTTSVEQIKRLARDTSGLNVVGPGLIVADH